MKVHECAKQYGLSSKELIEALKKEGFAIKSHMSKLDDDVLAQIKTIYAKKATTSPAESPKKPQEKTAKKKPRGRKKVVSQKQKEPKTVKRGRKKSVKEKPEEKKPVVKKEAYPAPIVSPKGEKKVPLSATALRKAYDKRPESLQIKMPISVSALATNLMIKTSELIKALMSLGVFATVNHLLDEETVIKVAEKFNTRVEKLPSEEEQLIQVHEEIDDEGKLKLRWPIVTMMGHVDHGKTSLLDAIRKTNVVDREAGKITQHIGAYEVQIPSKGKVTFLDTPGHSAFTAMRARGANVTDVVVLVVAADDGVMPQTIEAINHARAAETPIVVAINKCDLPAAHADRVKSELQKQGLTAEDWGGKTIMVSVSAKTGDGVDGLLEMLLLEAEILELKANPDRLAQGTVIEGKLSKSLGTVVHVLVQNGTLHVGDVVVCGRFYGKVRALHNDKGKNMKEAGPSTPAQILGMNGVPEAGERFYVVNDEKQARNITAKRLLELKEKSRMGQVRHMSLEGLYEQMKESGKKELKIIIKADVQGSVEVLKDSLEKLSNEKIRLKVIHGGVGGINESDVVLAAASDAIIIGFHVKADPQAQGIIEKEKVDIKYYRIIYEAINDVKLAMEGLLEPTIREEVLGHATVQQVFKASKVGSIAGCSVKKGKIVRNQLVRLIRNNIVIYEGKMASLRRFKDDVKEASEGYECGVVLERYADLKAGDIIESYKEEKVATKM